MNVSIISDCAFVCPKRYIETRLAVEEKKLPIRTIKDFVIVPHPKCPNNTAYFMYRGKLVALLDFAEKLEAT